MAGTRKWDDLYKDMDAISADERDEIALKVVVIGEVLAARKASGMTQSDMESATGVKQTMIARLENNHMDPQLTTILKILRPLGKTLAVVPIAQPLEQKSGSLNPRP